MSSQRRNTKTKGGKGEEAEDSGSKGKILKIVARNFT